MDTCTHDTARPRQQIRMQAPARLHLGFLDLHGGLGRRFGSIGLALETPSTILRFQPSDRLSVDGPGAERLLGYVHRLSHDLGLVPRVHIDVLETIPDHVGLGSGTQLALAVGMGLARLQQRNLTPRDVACVTERGARSGIGIGSFELGGFQVDGGRAEQSETPPLIARSCFPEHWRVLLVLDQRGQGLHGQQEVAAFKALPAFPSEQAAHLCRLVLMQMLPALAEHDLDRFGAAITELQQCVGDHFAPAQGGRFTSGSVSRAMEWLAQRGATGIGQSSWGPTGFCFVGDAAHAENLAREARLYFANQPELQFQVTKARNQGCAPVTEPLPQTRTGVSS